jgi:nucleotide-binding universal stress UspA family protein
VSSTGMSHDELIGCATRGGDASRATEDCAIALAHDRQAELIFLYVVDAGFAAGRTGKFDLEMVAQDLREIGKIVLEQAKERARQKGVTARSEIREGNVADEIQRFVEKHKNMDLLVIGHMSEELREHLEPVLQRMAGDQRIVVVAPQR